MDEYIERHDAIKRIRKQCHKCDARFEDRICRSCRVRDDVDTIREIPAADVVEVVRCKDCKWYNNRMCYHPRFDYVCEVPPTMMYFDYCRYGERREDNGNEVDC